MYTRKIKMYFAFTSLSKVYYKPLSRSLNYNFRETLQSDVKKTFVFRTVFRKKKKTRINVAVEYVDTYTISPL